MFFLNPQLFIDPEFATVWKDTNSTVLADSEIQKIKRLKNITIQGLLNQQIALFDMVDFISQKILQHNECVASKKIAETYYS